MARTTQRLILARTGRRNGTRLPIAAKFGLF
jgi:hypothetical protein